MSYENSVVQVQLGQFESSPEAITNTYHSFFSGVVNRYGNNIHTKSTLKSTKSTHAITLDLL